MTDPDDDDELTGQLAEMARQAGLTDPDLGPWMIDFGGHKVELIKFAVLVAKECARLCAEKAVDQNPPFKQHENTYGDGWLDASNECTWAIRARFGLDGDPK